MEQGISSQFQLIAIIIIIVTELWLFSAVVYINNECNECLYQQPCTIIPTDFVTHKIMSI